MCIDVTARTGSHALTCSVRCRPAKLDTTKTSSGRVSISLRPRVVLRHSQTGCPPWRRLGTLSLVPSRSDIKPQRTGAIFDKSVIVATIDGCATPSQAASDRVRVGGGLKQVFKQMNLAARAGWLAGLFQPRLYRYTRLKQDVCLHNISAVESDLCDEGACGTEMHTRTPIERPSSDGQTTAGPDGLSLNICSIMCCSSMLTTYYHLQVPSAVGRTHPGTPEADGRPPGAPVNV